jgi:hypothetical protein
MARTSIYMGPLLWYRSPGSVLSVAPRFGRITRAWAGTFKPTSPQPDKQNQTLSCADCIHSCHRQGQCLPGLTKWLGGGLRGAIIASCFATASQNCRKSPGIRDSSHRREPKPASASKSALLTGCQTANLPPVATSYIRVLHTSHAQLDARAHEAP